jgi:predicted peroxiredoxin
MKTFYFITIIAALLRCSMEISAQDRTFNLDVYKQFLIDNEDISPAELYELYPSGLFKDSVTPFNLNEVNYLNKIDSVYTLTPAEKSLLMKNGFVVTERQQTESFVGQFRDIFYKDLPVFVSTDAMLHAFHASYDAILKQVELQFLIPKLKELLSGCHSKIKDLDEKYGQNQAMKPMLRDVDVYFTVALKLLGESVSPFYIENSGMVNELLDLIQKEKPESYKLFSESCPRELDFSQFKPRGHYTDQYWPKLQNYFKTMIWLGRIEIYLSQPSSTINNCEKEQMNQTVQRQIIDAALIQEISSKDDITGIYNKMEEVVSFFVGEQDNVTLNDLAELFNETGVMRADSFLVNSNIQKFQNNLKSKPWSSQNILSQILSSDPSSPE